MYCTLAGNNGFHRISDDATVTHTKIPYRHTGIYDSARTAPCARRHLRLSSLQTGFRSESVRRPRDRFLVRSSRGSRSSASAPLIPGARTLGSRAAERVDLELGGSCGDGETTRSLGKIFVVLLLLRGDESALYSLLETYLCGACWVVGA